MSRALKISEVTVRARMPAKLRDEAESVLERIGVTPSAAMRMFYSAVLGAGGLPFKAKVPNPTTAKAISDSVAGAREARRYDSVDDAFEALNRATRTESERGKKRGRKSTVKNRPRKAIQKGL